MTINETDLQFGCQLKRRSRTEMIVLHHSASGSADALAVHKLHLAKGWGGIGYHFLIRKDGSVLCGRPVDYVGAHAKGNNLYSIGICFEGNFEIEEMGSAQRSAGIELIRELLSRYAGGLRIVRHRDLEATACPGALFPAIEADAIALSVAPSGSADCADKRSAPAAWAAEACSWAMEKRLFLGDGNGGYRWGDYISRQELAVVLYRFRDAALSYTGT